jgi:hypothetical protein
LIQSAEPVEVDLRYGEDSSTGKKIQEYQVPICPLDVKCFAECYQSQEFANELYLERKKDQYKGWEDQIKK